MPSSAAKKKHHRVGGAGGDHLCDLASIGIGYSELGLPHDRLDRDATRALDQTAADVRGDLFFFNDPASTEIYPLSLHDALPISPLSPLPNVDSDTTVDGTTQPGYAGHPV